MVWNSSFSRSSFQDFYFLVQREGTLKMGSSERAGVYLSPSMQFRSNAKFKPTTGSLPIS